MDYLPAQMTPARCHPLLVSVEHRFDEVTAPNVLDRRQQRTQLRGTSQIPQELTARSAVKEAPQPERHPRVRRAIVANGVVSELCAAVPPAQSFKQAHQVRPIGPLKLALFEQASNRKARVYTYQVFDRRGLQLER